MSNPICFLCNTACDLVAANPGRWPVHLGNDRDAHISCVNQALYSHGELAGSCKRWAGRCRVLENRARHAEEVLRGLFEPPQIDEIRRVRGLEELPRLGASSALPSTAQKLVQAKASLRLNVFNRTASPLATLHSEMIKLRAENMALIAEVGKLKDRLWHAEDRDNDYRNND